MKKISKFFMALVLFSGVSFATSLRQDNKNTQAPQKAVPPHYKKDTSGHKQDSIKHLKKLPPPNTSNK